ncbi:acyl-CoA N-acyltransferase, partial [Teratosphaeria nubilosa]
VDLRRCTREDLPHFKRLNSLLLPIPYPESFYREIVDDPLTNNITLLATWHDDPARKGQEKGRLIGAVRARLFAHPPTPQRVRANASQVKDGPMLYLSTLVLLSPYRSYGIATRMLDILLKRAVEDYGITTVGAHVWEANTEGLEWYRKRSFQEVHREAEYYRRLQPSGAVVMQR